MIVFFFSLGCGRVQNSSSNDASTYGGGVSGNSSFLAARAVIASKCLSCHADWGTYSASDYTSHSLVTAGSPNTSSLYTRIRGNDSGIAGDMPQTGSNLTTDEVATIKSWITTM